MKSRMSITLATMILALGTAFCPHHAAADTSTNAPATANARPTGKAPMVYMVFVMTNVMLTP